MGSNPCAVKVFFALDKEDYFFLALGKYSVNVSELQNVFNSCLHVTALPSLNLNRELLNKT